MEKFIQEHLQYLIEVRTRNGRTNIDNYLDEYLAKNNNNILKPNFLSPNLINYILMNNINNMSNNPTIYNYFSNINRGLNIPLINQNNLNTFNSINSINNINTINNLNNYKDNINIVPIKSEQELDKKEENQNSNNNNNIKSNISKEQILKILDALIKTTKKPVESNNVK